jgi:hypothetical protein
LQKNRDIHDSSHRHVFLVKKIYLDTNIVVYIVSRYIFLAETSACDSSAVLPTFGTIESNTTGGGATLWSRNPLQLWVHPHF